MAILFSAVGIRAGDAELKFLVGGIPRELEDLEKYVRWGVGADTNATWDDLPRIMIQMEENPNFLSEKCDHVEDVNFSFDWSQQELFGLKMEEVL